MNRIINPNLATLTDALTALNTLATLLQQQADEESARIAAEQEALRRKQEAENNARAMLADLPLIVKTERRQFRNPTESDPGFSFFVEVTDGKRTAYFSSVSMGCRSTLDANDLREVSLDSRYTYCWEKAERKTLCQLPRMAGCRRSRIAMEADEPIVKAFVERCMTVPVCFGEEKMIYLAR